jgi:hypothetical protein
VKYLLEKPLFPYSSEFVSDDNSNFLGDYAGALMAIENYYNDYVTTNSVSLIQVTVFDYLFIIDNNERFDILKVKMDDRAVELVASFDKLVLRDND